MFRTKSRRNIRSKRNLSKKNRSRKNRNSRRVKGGIFGIQDMGIKFSLAKKYNSRILCKYRDILANNTKENPMDLEINLRKIRSNIVDIKADISAIENDILGTKDSLQIAEMNETLAKNKQELAEKEKELAEKEKELDEMIKKNQAIQEKINARIANFKLYRIGYSEDYPVSDKHPNPMSIQDIIDTHNPDIQFLYIATNMECSATVM